MFMSEAVIVALIGALATIVATWIQVRWRQEKKRDPRSSTKGRADRTRKVIFWLSLVVAVVFFLWAGLVWLREQGGPSAVQGGSRNGSQTAQPPPNGETEEAPCRSTGRLVGLLIETSEGRERIEGQVEECAMLTALDEEQSLGVGFRPRVVRLGDPPREVVRIEVVEIRTAGTNERPKVLTTIAVPEGESARVQSPDGEGFLTLTVTSLTSKNQSAGE
jgi:hypothetical protein